MQKNIFIFLALVNYSVFAAPLLKPLFFFKNTKEEVICLGEYKAANFRQCDRTINISSVDSAIKRILEKSDEALPLFSQQIDHINYVVFVARIPSRSPHSTTYCGAGYEDHLILLRYDEKKVVLLDDFLLQSCLKSIVLDNDGDADILKSLTIDQENHVIGFRWINSPDDKAHRVTILNEKFLLN